MKSNDPSRIPEIDPEVMEQGRQFGLWPVNVVCHEPEPDPKALEGSSVSFIAFVSALPRPGETVFLEDNARCIVKNIFWQLARPFPGTKFLVLTPNVIAHYVAPVAKDKTDEI